MVANEMTFGIEIETHIPAGRIPVGHHGEGLPIVELAGWKADRDPSIHCGAGREACEFVSPVFRGSEGLAKLLADIRTIKSMGAKVNASCGLHIHVGFDRTDSQATARLATVASNFETAIFAATGTKNRERGRWCKSLRRHGEALRAIQSTRWDRYHVVNFGSGHPTVEFRAFSASLNPQKIAGFVCMTLSVVERAMATKRGPKWTPKPTVESSPIHRGGEGQTQLTRFFYTMGWTKGRVKHVFGNLLPDVRGFKRIKKTLMQLAEKYDRQQ